MDRSASDREVSNRESSRPSGQRGRSRARSRSPNLPGYQDGAGDQAPGRSFVQPGAQPPAPPARQPPAQQQAIPYLQPSPSGQGVQSVVPSYMGVIPLKKPNFNIVVNGERIPVERASAQELLDAINDYVDRHGYHPNRYEYFDRRPRRRMTFQDIESNLVDDRRRRAYVDNQRRLAADRAAEAARRAIDEGPPLLEDQSQEPDFDGYGGQHRQFPQCGTTQDNVVDDSPFVNNNEWQAATRRSPSPVQENLYGDGDYIVNPGDNAWGNGDNDDPYGIYGADDDDDSSSSNRQRLPSPELPVLLRPPEVERLLGRLGSPYEEYHRARNQHDGLPDEEWARFYWSLPEAAQAEIFQDDVLIEIIFDGKTVTDYISGIIAKILEHPPSVPLEVFKNIPISPDWRDFLTTLAQPGEIKPWYWVDIMHHIMSGISPLQWQTRLERFHLGVFDDGSVGYLGSTTSPLSSPPSSPPEELTQFVESELAIVRERELAAHLRNLARMARERPSQIFSPDVHGTIDQWINLPERFRKLGITSSTSRSLLIRLLKPYGYDLDVHGNMFEWVAAGMPDGRGQRQQNPDYDPAVHGTFAQWQSMGSPSRENLIGSASPMRRSDRYDHTVHGNYFQWDAMGRPSVNILLAAARRMINLPVMTNYGNSPSFNSFGEYDPNMHGTVHQWFEGFPDPIAENRRQKHREQTKTLVSRKRGGRSIRRNNPLEFLQDSQNANKRERVLFRRTKVACVVCQQNGIPPERCGLRRPCQRCVRIKTHRICKDENEQNDPFMPGRRWAKEWESQWEKEFFISSESDKDSNNDDDNNGNDGEDDDDDDSSASDGGYGADIGYGDDIEAIDANTESIDDVLVDDGSSVEIIGLHENLAALREAIDYWMFTPVFNHSVSNHCGFQAMADAITSTRRILLGPDAQAVSGQDLLEILFEDQGNNELVPTEGFQNYIDQQPIQSQQELRRSHTISDEHFRAILILLGHGEGTEPYRLGIIARSGPDQEVVRIYTIDPPGSEDEPILWIVNDGFEDIAPADLGAINHWEALGTPLANSPHPDTAWFNNLRRVMDSVNDSKITMDDGAQSPHVGSSANAGEGPSSAPTPRVRNGKRKASRDGADGEQSPKRHRTSSASSNVTVPRPAFPATPSPSDVLYTSLNDVADSQINQYDPDALIRGQINPENDPLAVELENEMRRMFEDG